VNAFWEWKEESGGSGGWWSLSICSEDGRRGMGGRDCGLERMNGWGMGEEVVVMGKGKNERYWSGDGMGK
jgi:hypothetical protein